jgi:hypothetical protein
MTINKILNTYRREMKIAYGARDDLHLRGWCCGGMYNTVSIFGVLLSPFKAILDGKAELKFRSGYVL